MATQFQHRLIIIVPVARFAAWMTWYQANIDSTDTGTSWPGLNVAGDNSAATHRWASMVLIDTDLRALLGRACQIASITPLTLAQWNASTQAQKIAWLNSVRDGLFTAVGIWLDVCGNAHSVNSPEDALTRVGVKRRTT